MKSWKWERGDDPFESALTLAEFLKLEPEELDQVVQLAFSFAPEEEPGPFD